MKSRDRVDGTHQIGRGKWLRASFMRTSLKNHSESISGELLITPIHATLLQIHPGHLPLRAQHIPRTDQALPDEASRFFFLAAMARSAMSWATGKKREILEK